MSWLTTNGMGKASPTWSHGSREPPAPFQLENSNAPERYTCPCPSGEESFDCPAGLLSPIRLAPSLSPGCRQRTGLKPSASAWKSCNLSPPRIKTQIFYFVCKALDLPPPALSYSLLCCPFVHSAFSTDQLSPPRLPCCFNGLQFPSRSLAWPCFYPFPIKRQREKELSHPLIHSPKCRQ